MAVKHFPSTILMFIILLASLFISWLIPISILITPALTILILSLLIERIFKKYMPEKSEDAVAQGVDEWYLE